jgi:hypothetical protein
MNAKLTLLTTSLLGLVACVTPRSEIQAKPVDHEETKVVPDNGPPPCEVQDFPGNGDVPEGSKNLGSVSVAKEATDEDTYAALRKAVCEKGGDAMSTMRWLHTIGKKDGPPTDLEATAWQLP